MQDHIFRRVDTIDAIIPMVIPKEGITRSELAKALNLTYSQATKALERMRGHKMLSRRIAKSKYVYRLTDRHNALTNSVMNVIYTN